MKKLNPYTKQKNVWRKRRELARSLKAEGLSLSKIGDRIGCSKQRVYQLLSYEEVKV